MKARKDERRDDAEADRDHLRAPFGAIQTPNRSIARGVQSGATAKLVRGASGARAYPRSPQRRLKGWSRSKDVRPDWARIYLPLVSPPPSPTLPPIDARLGEPA